ncbi:MAG: inosine-5-monophosphate dehydrogenase [Maricaulis sp.]|nr:inosine-5-monophosphate dehydrogenase [Maricaulis sp.]HAQ35497.1 inosine-5-monophosphate dehydrogenase [Alphaproteobacteria bacterium]
MNVAAILEEKGRDVVTLKADATLSEAASRLDHHGIGAVVIVANDGAIAGVLSERDIVRQVARQGAAALVETVAGCMTRDVVTAKPADTLEAVMASMTDRRIRHLPVVENGQLSGIVSIGDVVKRRIDMTEAEAEAMKAYIASA